MPWEELQKLRSGDVIAFSGRSRVSRIIRVGTCSRYSHVAGVVMVTRETLVSLWQAKRLDARIPAETVRNWPDQRLVLFEATTLCTADCLLLGRPVRGVQAHDPATRIADYNGRVYRVPLRDDAPFDTDREYAIASYFLTKVGHEYDDWSAVMSATHLLKWLVGSRQQLNKFFCDELVADALKRVSLFPMGAADKNAPGKFLRILLEDYYDEPVRIK